MLDMVDKGKALNIAKKYFYLLEKTGYVKNETVRKYLVYLFCLDLLEYGFPFMEEDDYVMVDRLLKRMFTGGGCLLPYNVVCAGRVKLGSSMPMGTLKIRKTEYNSIDRNSRPIGYKDRSTQDDKQRTV